VLWNRCSGASGRATNWMIHPAQTLPAWNRCSGASGRATSRAIG